MLKDILAISGQSGLFRFVSQSRNGIIVEHLETKQRTNAYATAKISSLEDISIFTDEGDVPLKDVFKAMAEKLGEENPISHKASGNELKSFMGEVLPTYDRERVYVSDIKKMVQWYAILKQLDMLKFDKAEEENDQEETSDEK